MKTFVRYICVVLTALMVANCQDYLMSQDGMGDGKATVSVTVDFKPMSSTLAPTRTSGTAMKDITSLHVLVYDKEKQLVKNWNIEDYAIEEMERSDVNADNGTSAEKETKHATFKLPERIEFGEYYMYAVGNIPDLLTNSKYSESIKKADGLKNLCLEWDAENISNNAQMMGCLTNLNPEIPPANGADELLVVSETTMDLHAWLRRAVSKVTVAYDGSGLKDGVSIHIKALRIKNIPKTCLLGADNTITSSDNLIETGEEVSYEDGVLIENTDEGRFYPRILVQKEEDGAQVQTWEKDPNAHSEDNQHSLFFYENKQGEGPDKKQTADDEGQLVEFQYKEKPCATYIEVDAYYESVNPEHPGVCNITYRFMLGQDVEKDYNATRNCHYKLTLHFNGFADDPDWRIDYVTRLQVTQPNPVDYRGKYFVPNNTDPNQGHEFKADNAITVTSFMYATDSWSESQRTPVKYKIEYREDGSSNFVTTPPSWLDALPNPSEEQAENTLKITYKNPYTEVKIDDLLKSNDSAKTGVYDLAMTKNEKGEEKMNTANCYIVDSKGTYKFPLVYGNAVTDGTEISSPYTYNGGLSTSDFTILSTFKNYKDGDINTASILTDIYGSTADAPTDLTASLVWQDARGLIKNIKYDKTLYTSYGGIQFTVGDEITEGNAVIALKDKDDTIMWSWHIWVTAFDFSRKMRLTNHVGQKFDIMPVNLGWCSGGNPVRYYDRHVCEVKFTQVTGQDENGEDIYGLSKTVTIVQEPHIAVPQGNNPYFQWGRKDPFVAAGTGTETVERTDSVWIVDSNGNLTWEKDKEGNPVTEKNTYIKTLAKTWYYIRNGKEESSTADPTELYAPNQVRKRTSDPGVLAELIKKPNIWLNCQRKKNTDDTDRTFMSDDLPYLNLWDNGWNGWAAAEKKDAVKTIYDPCPAGYHVSSLYTFGGFTPTGENISDVPSEGKFLTKHMYAAMEDHMLSEPAYYNTNLFEFYTDATKLVSLGFPQNGYRDWDAYAQALSVNKIGQIWHAQLAPYTWVYGGLKFVAYHFEYERYTHIWPTNTFYSTDGMAVRPVVSQK